MCIRDSNRTSAFNPKNRTNWDGELFVDMGLVGARFKCVKNIYSGYRVHDESITGTMSTADKMQGYKDEMYMRITGNSISSYSKSAAIYFKYRRKLLNYSDTIQRVFGRRSCGRSVKGSF